MRGHNHVDGRLKLRPCDYLDPPQQFGTTSNARVVVPPGGDARSAEAAVHQHRMVMASALLTYRPTRDAPRRP